MIDLKQSTDVTRIGVRSGQAGAGRMLGVTVSSLLSRPVLATCDIQPPVEAFENTKSRLLLLADSEGEEYNLKHSSAHLHKGGMYTVHGFLTYIKWSTGLCLQ
jgi:hypothetical protein